MPVALTAPKFVAKPRQIRFALSDMSVALLFALIPLAILIVAVLAGGSDSILAIAPALQP